jgi:hypothetical protein
LNAFWHYINLFIQAYGKTKNVSEY